MIGVISWVMVLRGGWFGQGFGLGFVSTWRMDFLAGTFVMEVAAFGFEGGAL